MPPDPLPRPDALDTRLELRIDADAPKGNLVPVLARLLRRLRDREEERRRVEAGRGK